MENSMPQNKQTQSGNVFILILIGVLLFGALGFTFTRSASKGSGNLTKQQAKIAAQEMINYARLVEGAVDRVRRNGCSETEINFYDDVIPGYSNPNARTDESCNIFSDNGGKISLIETMNSAQINFRANPFAHPDAGIATKSDLIMYYRDVEDQTCLEINNILNIVNTGGNIPDGSAEIWGGTTNTWTFDLAALNRRTESAGGELDGKFTGCFIFGTINTFYHVLLAQ
jgi:hypothetical protein